MNWTRIEDAPEEWKDGRELLVGKWEANEWWSHVYEYSLAVMYSYTHVAPITPPEVGEFVKPDPNVAPIIGIADRFLHEMLSTPPEPAP